MPKQQLKQKNTFQPNINGCIDGLEITSSWLQQILPPMNNVIFLIKTINNRVAQNKTVINLALNMLIPNKLKKKETKTKRKKRCF